MRNWFWNILYLGCSIIQLIYFKHFISSNDALAYLDVSSAYLKSDFTTSLSGYWSPLYSWIAIPFLYFNLNGIIALKLINIGGGLIGLIAFIKLSKLIIKVSTTRNFILLLFILLSVYTQCILTPDYIGNQLLLLIIYYLLKYTTTQQESIPYKIALVSAILYFLKAYNLIFVNLTVLSYIVLYGLKIKDFVLLRKFFVRYLITHSILILILIIPLSKKYNEFTFEKSSEYNFSLINPSTTGLEEIEESLMSLLVKSDTILPPLQFNFIHPDDERIQNKIKHWSPFSSKEFAQFYFHVLVKNLKSLYYDYHLKHLVFFLVMLILITIIIKKFTLPNNIIFLIVFCCIYVTGYLMIFYIPRYCSVLLYITILVSGFYLEIIANNEIRNSILAFLILIVFRDCSIGFLKLKNQKNIQTDVVEQITKLDRKEFNNFITVINNRYSKEEINEVQFVSQLVCYYKNVKSKGYLFGDSAKNKYKVTTLYLKTNQNNSNSSARIKIELLTQKVN